MKRIVFIFFLLLFFSQRSKAQAPTITVAKSDFCVPGVVTLELTNCATCNSWEWDLGSGPNTGTAKYQAIITTAGTYDVSCKYTTTSGSVATVTLNDAFTAHGKPIIQFSLNKPVFCNADSVIITDITSGSVYREWFIGNKSYPNAPKTMKLGLSTQDPYKSVFLLAKDTWGCVGNKLVDSAFAVFDSVKLQMNASYTVGCAPKLLNFTPLIDSGGPNGQSVKTFAWSFPGASPGVSAQRNPKNISYTTADTFDARLKITTHQGCTYNYFENNVVSLGDSTALNLSTSKSSVCVNEPFTLTNTNAKTNKLQWIVTGTAFSSDSLWGKVIKGKLKDTGSIHVTIQENNKGCISKKTINSLVTALGPKASFTSDLTNYCSIPDTFNFTNTSVVGLGVTTWNWTIYEQGVGSIATGSSKNFSYNTNKLAKYDVRLIAIGSTGCRDTFMVLKAVVGDTLRAKFTVNPIPACVNQTVSLISVSVPGNTKYKNLHTWTFYNASGGIDKVDNNTTGKHTYGVNGKYSAKLLVYNMKGCKDSVKYLDTIKIATVQVQIKVVDSLLCTSESAFFVAIRSVKSPTAFGQWVFENEDSANNVYYRNGDSINVSLYVPGRWKVSYTLTDTSGGSCVTVYNYPGRVRVSGAVLSISANPDHGCEPLSTTLSSKILGNTEYDNPLNKPMTYRWTKRRGSGWKYTDSLKSSTGAVAKKGIFYPYLVYKNGSGCEDSTDVLTITSGVAANFEIYSSTRCVNTWLTTKNHSATWATSFEYICDSPSVKFSPSKFVAEPNIMFTKAGYFFIRLVAKYAGCSDTFVIEAKGYEAVASFTAPDSTSFCAPKAVTFYNSSSGTYNNYWSFGDGRTGFSQGNEPISHLYVNNKSKPGYDIQLIAEHVTGCRDTLLKKGYVVIVGPVPDLRITNVVGCDPMLVKFENRSSDFSRFYLDYDDGSVLDSIYVKDHIYKVVDNAFLYQVFKPKLLLYDSLGCFAVGNSTPDSIIVKKSPTASFTFTSGKFINGTEGCAGPDFLVKFTNTSTFFMNSSWDFNSDGTKDANNINQPSYFYRFAGTFYPTLYVVNANGCADTFIRDSIVALPPPTADFSILNDSICVKTMGQFTSTSTSKFPIVSYSWNFGEDNYLDDTAKTPSATYKFHTPFNHLVQLIVTDTKGCRNSRERNMYINDTLGPFVNRLNYVTVNPDNSVTFAWDKSKAGNFYSYRVIEDKANVYTLKQVYYNLKDTSYSFAHGNLVKSERVCYTLQMEDTCSQKGKIAQSHCTILLRDSAVDPFTVKLFWLSYDYWGSNLSHYEVFRKDPGASFIKIADVKAGRQSFIDSYLCNKNYHYYVEAVHRNRLFRSRSNEVDTTPVYKNPDRGVDVELVSVNNNQKVDVRWSPYYQPLKGSKYVVERSGTGLAGPYSTIKETAALSISDLTADFNATSYAYRVRYRDHCGTLGPFGSASNSVYLQGVPGVQGLSLQWNKYEYWSNGAKEYLVQYKNKNAGFITHVVNGPATLNLDNLKLGQFGQDSICFRIAAIQDTTGVPDTSYSNWACFVPESKLWIPNAFTPNDDNLNHVFKVEPEFIRNDDPNPDYRFTMKIFNRWGQQVFESYDYNWGWDGTFQGNKVPSGLYICRINAVGYDGQAYRYKGTIYLSR